MVRYTRGTLVSRLNFTATVNANINISGCGFIDRYHKIEATICLVDKCVCVCVRERERERKREGKRENERWRELYCCIDITDCTLIEYRMLIFCS